jgi:GT2 family glycosyltransferase
VKLSIGIKALNEAQHIRQAAESAIFAAEIFSGEVILADCGSTDGTIDLVSSLPIQIVQLSCNGDRSCGAGAQLAFQSSIGEYFLLMDGDMVLSRDFVRKAIEVLENDPKVAGVGGKVVEKNIGNSEFRIRAVALAVDKSYRPGIVDRLEGGGVYRRAAIEDVGFFSDRNLKALEEFELAARLSKKNWKLVRINEHAVDHYGHTKTSFNLLLYRLRSGNTYALGQILRSEAWRLNPRYVLSHLRHLQFSVAVIFWWVLLLTTMLTADSWTRGLEILLILFLLPAAFLIARRKSLALGLYSFANWNLTAAGVLVGLFKKRVSPHLPLPAITVQSGR